MEQEMKVTFVGKGSPPRCAPNPKYPLGIDMDFTDGAAKHCVAALPYPARGIGAWVIECPKCGARVACTTAGRPDDPRSAKLPCNVANNEGDET